MSQEMIDFIVEQSGGEEVLLADGFNEAVIGKDYNSQRVIYSVSKCVQILVDSQNMTTEEAIEYLEYNTLNCYVGENTPIWCYDML